MRSYFSTFAMLCVMLMAISMMLAACGKKPSQVDSPAGYETSTFPRSYPDPKTDSTPVFVP
jgi:hypothetical protein